MAEPTATPCVVCGATPSRVEPIRRHVGMIFLQRFVKLERPLCRDHGLELTRSYLLRTLWQGWWGLISFFVNWAVLVSDIVVLFRYRSLPPPIASGFAGAPGVMASPSGPVPPSGPMSPPGPMSPSGPVPRSGPVPPFGLGRPPSPPIAPTVTPAGWYPDPSGRYEHRWYDGRTWTAAVAHRGQTGHDPLPAG
jgi:hypothetical protein